MINTKTLKLEKQTKMKKHTIKKLANKEKRLSDEDINELLKERENLQRAIEELNITDELRTKKISDLKEEEKDALYNEYVLSSTIDGITDFIEGRYYTHEEFLQIIKEMWGDNIEL